jgi:hypothetical protein
LAEKQLGWIINRAKFIKAQQEGKGENKPAIMKRTKNNLQRRYADGKFEASAYLSAVKCFSDLFPDAADCADSNKNIFICDN